MKTVTIPAKAKAINKLLDQARAEDLLVKAADGSEYILASIDEFDLEVARTRRNKKLMALLDKRARQTETMPLAQVERHLGL